MYRVTAILDGAEIGFGEGDSYEWAMQEAIEGTPEWMRGLGVNLHARKEGHCAEIITPLALYLEFCPA